MSQANDIDEWEEKWKSQVQQFKRLKLALDDAEDAQRLDEIMEELNILIEDTAIEKRKNERFNQ